MERTDAIQWIFGDERAHRFTQNSPILPEVWLKFLENTDRKRIDVLLTPHRNSTPGKLRNAILHNDSDRSMAPMVYNESHIVVRVTLVELIRFVLPQSRWWSEKCLSNFPSESIAPETKRISDNWLEHFQKQPSSYHADFRWFVLLINAILTDSHLPKSDDSKEHKQPFPLKPGDVKVAYDDSLSEVLRGLPIVCPAKEGELWSVSLNREAKAALYQSRKTVKADAAAELFHIDCSNITWAVVDSGIDARHNAFQKSNSDPTTPSSLAATSRVRETYDFTRLRLQMSQELDEYPAGEVIELDYTPEGIERHCQLLEWVRSGRMLDWERIIPSLRVEHNETDYKPPVYAHGTHVAGIIGAKDSNRDSERMTGLCPEIQFFDLRVLDATGCGSEFEVMSALQFIRYLNSHKDVPVIHGVNLSLGLEHDVKSSACGRSPICEECERLVGSGVVVVVAAGNSGYVQGAAASLAIAKYQDITIADPGNAESVITVGSTHKEMPHTYGVSYFSSRGPTGDGRQKPDLVAPGEKIFSTLPDECYGEKDGTSMAAPHVSGAAAMLMARHVELKGQPAKVKKILCDTATDLKREKYFQGAGAVDILRAIQSV